MQCSQAKWPFFRTMGALGVAAVMLVACGGGSSAGDDSESGSGTPPAGDSGPQPTLATRFVPTGPADETANFFFVRDNSGEDGKILFDPIPRGSDTEWQQGDRGELLHVSDMKAGAGMRVEEIVAERDYASGIWVGATFTDEYTQTVNANRRPAYYIVYNPIKRAPAEARNTQCSLKQRTGRASSTDTAQVSGTASLAFANGKGQYRVDLQVTDASGQASALPVVQGPNTFNANGTPSFRTSISSDGAMTNVIWTDVGEQSDGAYLLIAAWRSAHSSGRVYHGIAVFDCR